MRSVPEGTITAEATGSSPVVPAIPSERVPRISLQPVRVQMVVLSHPLRMLDKAAALKSFDSETPFKLLVE